MKWLKSSHVEWYVIEPGIQRNRHSISFRVNARMHLFQLFTWLTGWICQPKWPLICSNRILLREILRNSRAILSLSLSIYLCI